VRLAAAIFLGRCGDDAGRAVLAEAVGRNGERLDPVDEHAAIELCGVLDIGEARASLARRGLGLGRDPFSWHCRVALARLGDERARAAILKGLTAWTRDTRTHAVAAAGQAGLSEAEPRLRSMADNPQDAEPDAVREALRLLAVARDSAGSTRQ
jgi:HEAT repeat protein